MILNTNPVYIRPASAEAVSAVDYTASYRGIPLEDFLDGCQSENCSCNDPTSCRNSGCPRKAADQLDLQEFEDLSKSIAFIYASSKNIDGVF
ncbi:MAG: hypothetical protein LBG48_02455 [Rickettsiales bacterium]|jgi:hypothetical protein|nr:hypothetical protein [Rickettsiales bacterium]